MKEEILKNNREVTRETYDRGAKSYAEKFDSIGVRSEHVDEAFSYVEKSNPVVLEIGCGAGREAEYILQKTDNYVGVDISAGLISLAREKLPEAQFVVSDIATYEFKEGLDIVMAFASLLHISKEEMRLVLHRIHAALNEGGIVYLSLKRKDEYSERIEEGEHGSRQFYYYTEEDVLEAATDKFEELSYKEQEREESWFTMILRKK